MTLNEIRDAVNLRRPLIHAITNPISINQCANTVLAIGGRPVMAEHPEEVAEITRSAQSLLVNLGNITDARMESMMISAKVANENNIPIVMDVVGIACSALRKTFANELLQKARFNVIKGNYSEIYALNSADYTASGVDAENFPDIKSIQKMAVNLATKHNTIVLASGKNDIITNGKRLLLIKNGCSQLSSVTGTGCMLGMLCACYISVYRNISSVVTAASVLGICGEKAETKRGNGSFMTNLLDALSTLSHKEFEENIRTEEVNIEKN